ncbi:MAG: response regulator [Nitrospirae bacterium]|nr:MAG: response regulator [Nitrospirota bacterium]
MSRILIVEDNEKNRKLFKLVLGSIGHELLLAENGEEGIKTAEDERPELILMDIQMPVMDGISALKALKAADETRDIPVVALTSYAMKGDRERLLDIGFTAYMAKPIDVDKFKKMVGEILEAGHE